MKRKPRKQPGQRYSVESYCRAVHKAGDKAFPVLRAVEGASVQENERQAAQRQAWRDQHRWHPHQLRHNAARRLRRD